MQTLDPPILLVPDRSTALGEQVLPGNVPPEDDEGHLSGPGPEPRPLQGGAESEEVSEREGNEGAGT